MALRTLKRFTYRNIRRASAWFLRFLEANVLRSEHLVCHKNHEEPLIYGVFRKNKGVTFHSWGRGLIPESLAPEVPAVGL